MWHGVEKLVLRVGGDGEWVDSGGYGYVQCDISPFFSHLSQVQKIDFSMSESGLHSYKRDIE